ncbi:hypothetical protein [Archangium sp.]|jgi:hypothetical protein|uniref:hypothetical protein n=1 Tax=Archangium sp. TaxID=1872627 RepID=UPI00389A4498
MSLVRLCLLLVLLGWVGPARGADSLRAHTLSLLARGQVTEAVDYWVLTTGKDAPSWLMALKTAFDAGKQTAGACQGVAQSIATAFSRLGGKPELVELKTHADFVVFKMANGRDMMLTDNGYHLLVRMNDRAYDAYTGAAGMPWAEYWSRLGAQSVITQKVIEAVIEAP